MKQPLKIRKIFLVNLVLLAFIIVSLGAHQIILSKLQSDLGIKTSFRSSASATTDLSGDLTQDAIDLVISKGVPAVYGQELGVSFDSAQAMINKVKVYDPTYGSSKIKLSGDNLQRYIDVAIRISCEYCCSAKALITREGRAACGCAHSQAMRGLAAYLITNHGDEYSNDEILRELSRWKGIYFPKQMIKKMASQLGGSKEFTPDTASLVLGVDMPDYGQGGQGAPLPSEIKDLPGMVGGC